MILKTLILSLFCCICQQLLYAQLVNFKWAKQMGGASNETGNCITADAAGNVYTVGNFTGTVDFDPGPLEFSLNAPATEDIFVSKLDVDGNFLWAKQLVGSHHASGISIVLDVNRNIYITGSFSGQVDFDPGVGSESLTSIGLQDFFIVKFSSDGNYLWANQFGSQSMLATGNAITIDASGNVLATGMIDGTNGYVVKCAASGNILWEKRVGHATSICTSTSIVTDPAGNVYTTGYFSTNSITNPVDFDPGPGIYNLSPDGNADVFVSKLNADGDFVMARQIGGVNLEQAYSITLDAQGNILITGYFNGICDFDPGTEVFNMTVQGDEDIFITKLDVTGKFVWAKQIAGPLSEFGNAIVTDVDGNIYLSGYFYGTPDFDPGPAVYGIATKGASDVFVTKLDGEGNFRWAISMGGLSPDWCHSLFLDGNGNIYTTGYFDNLVDFDIGPGIYNLTGAGNKDIFVHKISYCRNVSYSSITALACEDYVLNGHTYTESGNYTQYLLNANGCDSILRLNLTITRKFTIVDKTICEGQSYYAGGANQISSGVYFDRYITSLGCDSVIQTNLTVLQKPKPNLGRDGNLCSANNAVLISPGTFAGYLWQDNSTAPGYIVNNPGKFWVTVTDINNCSATDTLTVSAIDTIPDNFLPPGQDLCYGNVLKIAALNNYRAYQWSTGSTGNFINVDNFGTYYLTVEDLNGCTGIDSITISRKNCIYLAIPNAFTPNDDTKNDVFRPEISQTVRNFGFIVFNRYGQKVFETQEYGKAWDGKFKGKEQPVGSYIYRIKYTNIFGVDTVEHGSVLLIR